MTGERYKGNPLQVTIGQQAVVEIPPRVFSGHVTGLLFEVDKTFLLPGAVGCAREIKSFFDDHPQASVLVIGHSDATGADDHNRELSEERARAVAAFLADDIDAWLGYYGKGKPGKPWGRLEDQHMLGAVGEFHGIANGGKSRAWRAAVEKFQGEAGVGVTGDVDDATRRKLVEKYLEQAGTSLPAGTKVTTHGCGEAHPLDRGKGDAANRRNRRVDIFLFEGEIEPAAQSPCPGGGCAEYATWTKRSEPIEHLGEAPDHDVVLAFEWPRDVVDQLPRDTVLRLTGADIPAQEKKLAGAPSEHDMVRVEFHWPQIVGTTRLEAEGGGKTVVLWQDRVVGDVDLELGWEGLLDELLPDPAAESGGGSPKQVSQSQDALWLPEGLA